MQEWFIFRNQHNSIYQQIKEKKIKILSMDANKAFGKIQQPLVIKALWKRILKN